MGRGGEEAAHLEALAPSSIRHLLAENEVARALNPSRVLIRLPLKRERFDREHRGVGEANSPATVPATIGSLGLADVLNRSFGDARDLGGAVVGELALEDVERGNACKDARNVKSMYVEERNRRRLPTCGCTLGVAVLDHDVAWGDVSAPDTLGRRKPSEDGPKTSAGLINSRIAGPRISSYDANPPLGFCIVRIKSIDSHMCSLDTSWGIFLRVEHALVSFDP